MLNEYMQEEQYWEGTFLIGKFTPQANYLVSFNNVDRIYAIEDREVVKRMGHNMTFMVPRRRERTLDLAKRLKIGVRVRIKLIQESRSKKWGVSTIQPQTPNCTPLSPLNRNDGYV